jgi:hypothetical protein
MKRLAKPTGPVVPTPSRAEAKQDATTRVAREIMDREAAAQAAKTARQRAARLARDAAMPAPPSPPRARKQTAK